MGTLSSLRARRVLGGAFCAYVLLLVLACSAPGASGGERSPTPGTTSTDPRPKVPGFDDAGRPFFGLDDAGRPIYGTDDAGRVTAVAANLGAIAVDERDDTAYVVQGFPDPSFLSPTDGGATLTEFDPIKTLYAVRPGEPTAREVARLDRRQGTSVSFPPSGVLVSAMTSAAVPGQCRGDLVLVAVGGGRELRRRSDAPCLAGPMLSPSGRWLAGAVVDPGGVAVVDAASLASAPLAVTGALQALRWAGPVDTLVTLAHSAGDLLVSRWDLAALPAAAAGQRALTQPARTLRSLGPAMQAHSPTHLDVSPDGRYAAVSYFEDTVGLVPQREQVAGTLRVFDLRDGGVRQLDGAFGPVAFTPDASTLVAYDRAREPRFVDGPDGGVVEAPSIWLVFLDLARFEAARVPLSLRAAPTFYVTRGGHRVVAVEVGGGDLVLYDVEMGRSTLLAKRAPALDEFVNRGDRELWVTSFGLHRLDLTSGALERVPLPFVPGRIGYFPRRDLFVFSRLRENALSFWDPASRAVTRTVTLPLAGRP